MKSIIKIITVITIVFASQTSTMAHCEIPCGIYHDQLRIELLKEHIQTIEKSMNMISELQSADNIDYNQLVRWIDNKEQHADKIQEIVTQYFMNQRIKSVDQAEGERYVKYIKELTLLHEMLVYSMKAKQSLNLELIEGLNSTLEDFEESYFSDKEHQH